MPRAAAMRIPTACSTLVGGAVSRRRRNGESRPVRPTPTARRPASWRGCASASPGSVPRRMPSHDLKLALGLGYWAGGPPAGTQETIIEAERLGFESIWTAEAYGSDALLPLAWWGPATERIKLGTGIVQISARTPAATAMAAMTLDLLSGGRFMLGLGVSGPQVVEGWYGEPFAKPLARMREYVSIVRDVFARREPVSSEGPHYPLPVRGREGITGLGKTLKSILHPL